MKVPQLGTKNSISGFEALLYNIALNVIIFNNASWLISKIQRGYNKTPLSFQNTQKWEYKNFHLANARSLTKA